MYAVEAIGARGLHFHDLRHTGNSFAAASGAGIKDLMARMGHDSERAAMIYLQESRGADQAIASTIDAHVGAERRRDGDDDHRLAGALVPVRQRHVNGTGSLRARRVPSRRCGTRLLTWRFGLERVTGSNRHDQLGKLQSAPFWPAAAQSRAYLSVTVSPPETPSLTLRSGT